MDTSSYWIDSAEMPVFPKLEYDIEVDTIIVGGGIAGITAATLLKKAVRTVVLIERGRFAKLDTGHTTAHLTAVTDVGLRDLIGDFGKEAARDVWDAGMAAIAQIASLVESHGIECNFKRQEGILHVPPEDVSADQIQELQRQLQAAHELGVNATYDESAPFFKVPGIRFPDQARFHPLRYLSALLRMIPGGGSHVFENTGAEKITDDPLTVTSGGYRIRGRYLVLATHTPLQGVASTAGALLFQSKLGWYTRYVIGARVPVGTVPEILFWDMKDPYDYLRVETYADYTCVIFGGEDHKTGQEEILRQPMHAWKSVLNGSCLKPRWCIDGLPYIGETRPNQFVGTGFAGNGMTFGTLTGMMAVDAALGRDNRWKKLFDPGRRKLGGVWNYLTENKDYPYHLVKDWLGKGAREPLETLLRNSGKVFVVDGQKVAASRDQAGEITVCSAVCPHLGCIVDWNEAEQTWDCPCHGSRFKPGGEVFSGPAESPLARTTPDADHSGQRPGENCFSMIFNPALWRTVELQHRRCPHRTGKTSPPAHRHRYPLRKLWLP